MKFIKTILFISLATVVFSCKTTTKVVANTSEIHTRKEAHWSYKGEEGPQYWSHLKEEYLACSGNAQSPINIEINHVVPAETKNILSVNYHNSSIDILNNGHTEEFLISEGNSIEFNGKTYLLKQFHMHTASEHTVDGKHFPLEIHFVNKAADNTYAVISVLFREGVSNPFLETYLSHFPEQVGEYKAPGKINVLSVLPNTAHYFHYKGSFTTPPCTEVVEWVVLKEQQTASKQQLDRLHALMHDNYRPVQPINNRTVEAQ